MHVESRMHQRTLCGWILGSTHNTYEFVYYSKTILPVRLFLLKSSSPRQIISDQLEGSVPVLVEHNERTDSKTFHRQGHQPIPSNRKLNDTCMSSMDPLWLTFKSIL